jgi:hypothetical protein
MSDPTSVKNAERLVVSLAAKHPSTGVLNVPVSRPLSASCPLSAVLYSDPPSILIRWTELKRLRPLRVRCMPDASLSLLFRAGQRDCFATPVERRMVQERAGRLLQEGNEVECSLDREAQYNSW